MHSQARSNHFHHQRFSFFNRYGEGSHLIEVSKSRFMKYPTNLTDQIRHEPNPRCVAQAMASFALCALNPHSICSWTTNDQILLDDKDYFHSKEMIQMLPIYCLACLGYAHLWLKRVFFCLDLEFLLTTDRRPTCSSGPPRRITSSHHRRYPRPGELAHKLAISIKRH